MRRAAGLFLTLVVLLALLVVADRVAVRATERAMVEAFDQQVDVTGATLDIPDFPFLTQVARGELTHATGSADTASFGGYVVTDLVVDARGVGIASPYVIRTGTASGLLSVDVLEQALREQAQLAADLGTQGDTLVLSGQVLGLRVAVAGRPRVADPDTLAIDIVSVDTGSGPRPVDELPSAVAAALTGLEVSLALPEGVGLDVVEVVEGSVRVEVSGTGVALEELVAS